MPHIIVEYSINLADHTRIDSLLQTLHQAALESGVFPRGGLRTRASPRQHHVIADGHADNAFVHVVLRIGHGRDIDTKRRVGDQIFGALCAYLEDAFENLPLAISLEIQEIDPELSFKKNNLHDMLQKRV